MDLSKVEYYAPSRWIFKRSQLARHPQVVLIDDLNNQSGLDAIDLSSKKSRKAFRKQLKKDLKSAQGSPYAVILNKSGRLRWWNIRARIDIHRLMNPKNQRRVEETRHNGLWKKLHKLLSAIFPQGNFHAAQFDSTTDEELKLAHDAMYKEAEQNDLHQAGQAHPDELSPAQARLLLYSLCADLVITFPKASIEITENDKHEARISGEGVSAYLRRIGITEAQLKQAQDRLSSITPSRRDEAPQREPIDLNQSRQHDLLAAGTSEIKQMGLMAKGVLLQALANTGAITQEAASATLFDDDRQKDKLVYDDRDFPAYLAHLKVTEQQLNDARQSLYEIFAKRTEEAKNQEQDHEARLDLIARGILLDWNQLNTLKAILEKPKGAFSQTPDIQSNLRERAASWRCTDRDVDRAIVSIAQAILKQAGYPSTDGDDRKILKQVIGSEAYQTLLEARESMGHTDPYWPSGRLPETADPQDLRSRSFVSTSRIFSFHGDLLLSHVAVPGRILDSFDPKQPLLNSGIQVANLLADESIPLEPQLRQRLMQETLELFRLWQGRGNYYGHKVQLPDPTVPSFNDAVIQYTTDSLPGEQVEQILQNALNRYEQWLKDVQDILKPQMTILPPIEGTTAMASIVSHELEAQLRQAKAILESPEITILRKKLEKFTQGNS